MRSHSIFKKSSAAGFAKTAVVLAIATLLLMTAFTSTRVNAQTNESIGNHASSGRNTQLPGDFYVMEDLSAQLNLASVVAGNEDAAFSSLPENRVGAEKTDSALWVRLELPASSDISQQRLLVFGPAYVDELQLFDSSQGESAVANSLRSGDAVPYLEKPYPSRLHVFELPNHAGTFYLRASSEGILSLNWQLTSETSFQAQERAQAIGYAMLLGVLVTMILFNLGIFMAIGDRTYVYYVLYHIGAAFVIYSLAGYCSQFLWPNYSNTTNRSVPIALTAMCFFGLLFMRSFLDLKRLLPKYYTILTRFSLLICVLAIPGLLLPYGQGAKFTYLGCLIVLPVMLVTVIVARANNIVTARYLALTFSFAVLPGSVGGFAYAYGLLPENMFTSHMLEITTVTETLLLSLFMAYRIKVSETEKLQAQQKNVALQKSFNVRMLAKQEEERGRIARELHDSVGPNLSALKIHLQSSEASVQDGSITPMLSNAQSLELLKNTIDEVRQLSHNLHPKQLDDLSLGNALVMFTKQFQGKDMPAFKLQLDAQEQSVREDKKLHLYRIAQEAIQNVITHAQATHCYISLGTNSNALEMSVRDNGKGFGNNAKQANGLGMTSMADRANIIGAELVVDSAPNEGTRVIVTLATSS